MMYPFKFTPILKPVIWGGDAICRFKGIAPVRDGIGESWEISHVKGNVSIVSNGISAGQSLEELIDLYGADILGTTVLEKFGTTFPLLIKFIDARDDLSIQVHPNDELAKQRHHSFGKTEMWYVIHASENASLYSGFKDAITPEKYIESVENNTFADKLREYRVQAGDVFFLPAGRVHAIRAGCFIAEIQQTSDITYRIYDYNRKDAQGRGRELHTEAAKDAIDYRVDPEGYKTGYTLRKNAAVSLVSCPYFTTRLIDGDQTLLRDFSTVDSFVIYICLEGKIVLKDANDYAVDLKQGESLLVPAAVKNAITLSPTEGGYKLVETFVGN
ncbi:MAG: class I mannose-6-phosphate isomerase [Dysgonamonadaceae bacterium]|jgi:mannose-6-phosphate isomerase|nr:class I mannose-6-phosphate isomerase [Dysgonamonadaceae bacterium]